jgi:hypothetical protein
MYFAAKGYFNLPMYFSSVARGNIESDLKHEETENVDSTVSKRNTLMKGVRMAD